MLFEGHPQAFSGTTQRVDVPMATPKPTQRSTAKPTPKAASVALSIREVAKQTGLTQAVLRIWELRYGWPRPGRRANGYRAYPVCLIPVLQAVREEMDRGRTIGDLLRDPVWSAILESGRLPTKEAPVEPLHPDWSTIPQPQGAEARSLRAKLEQALEREDSGAVALVKAQAGRLHPREREVAVTAVLTLWQQCRSGKVDTGQSVTGEHMDHT